jgi:hypothetical protein
LRLWPGKRSEATDELHIISSREDNGAEPGEGAKRKRGDSGREHGNIIKEADAIWKQPDLDFFARAHVEDSGLPTS